MIMTVRQHSSLMSLEGYQEIKKRRKNMRILGGGEGEHKERGSGGKNSTRGRRIQVGIEEKMQGKEE